MIVRKYRPGEEPDLQQLFHHTIREVNSRDYTPEQVRAWAPDAVDSDHWRDRMARINPYVCVEDNQIVGYADLQDSGLIDHFFVHHQWQGRGVGKKLFAHLESEASARGITELHAYVSITARPFFESRGFSVVATQEVMLGTLALTNFKMVKRGV